MTHKGSCLCGKMQYETGELTSELDHCHCTFCQKFHGAPFGTYAALEDVATFKWISGGEDVGRYQSSSHSARLFCNACGSSLVAEIEGGKILAVTAATLDDELKVDGVHHMFARSKIKWFDIAENETKYEEYPPYMDQFTPTD
ncbi:MAG: GFA family protein [Gammaproteobacteria bacterium]|nr:GFA family protein [Gammaproteobacteria bacterium]